MAVGDIWNTKVNCSTNNRAWSFGLWLEETTGIVPTNEGRVVADALHAHLNTALIAILSTESRLESVEAWRRHTQPARPGCVLSLLGVGLRTGDSAPNDNAIYVNLRQVAQDARFNGGIFIAGQSDSDMLGNKWVAAYHTTQIKAFTDLLPLFINAVGGDTGQFRVVVLSKKFLPAATPIGTPFDVVEATATDRVMTQRRRQQKVVGYTAGLA